jgi:Fibronectin type III domain
MRLWTITWMALLACLIEPFAMRCDAQYTTNVWFAWNPSPSPGVASYNFCYGTNSGIYPFTNNVPNTTTNVTIVNLPTELTYYFAVQAVGSNDLVSSFSSECTNAASYTNESSTNLPPPLPIEVLSGMVTVTNPIVSTNPVNTNIVTQPPAFGIVTNTPFPGVPPLLGLAVSNGQVNLNIAGTVGCLLNIMGTTNDISLNEWSAVTNVTLTNIASVAETNQAPQDLLNVAFVPAAQSVTLEISTNAPFQYYQVVMPYDYAILADQVLLVNTNYTPRLIVINMPGLVDDACYVNQVNSFIHYARTNYSLQLFSSGSTIRQIANGLSSYLNLDWTSASEFTYSNGMGQILATVIETEPPSSDPVAGQGPPSSPIVINF